MNNGLAICKEERIDSLDADERRLPTPSPCGRPISSGILQCAVSVACLLAHDLEWCTRVKDFLTSAISIAGTVPLCGILEGNSYQSRTSSKRERLRLLRESIDSNRVAAFPALSAAAHR